MNRRDFSAFLAALLSYFPGQVKAMLIRNRLDASRNISVDRIMGGELIVGESSTILISGKNLDCVECIHFESVNVESQIIEKDVSYLVVQIYCPPNISSDYLAAYLGFDYDLPLKPIVEISFPLLKPIEMNLANYDFGDYSFDDDIFNRNGYECEWRNIPNGFRLDCYFSSNDTKGTFRLPGVGSELI